MATTAWKNRFKKRQALVEKYAELRRKLKKEKDYVALARLPRDSSASRLTRRCEITGRRRGYYRKFRVSRIVLRQLASEGKIPGMRKSSW
ncbi:MAG: 30S ribosomal protein S14 [Planctomycetes bacterium]|jgi:small subunit ribosomal protein S14|nr:30S ribosomal protein S14 [Planctomycetota bacterium]MDA8379180.1 30S ribosomal protein S14 [Planctomycetia bacterium]